MYAHKCEKKNMGVDDMKLFILIVVSIFLCGCAETYNHPDPSLNNLTHLEIDKLHCRQKSAAEASSSGAGGPPFIMAEEVDKCLQLEHGWVKN
jgi:hypothetical protein